MGLNDDPLAALRARAKPVVRDRQDRVEATYAPDARKARDIVRAVAQDEQGGILTTLADLAVRIAKVTGDPAVRALLQDRAVAFVEATAVYQRVQGETPRDIAWLGQDARGNFHGTVPPGTPEHKMLLVAAWGALLRAVNEATKVGVWKQSRYKPISLLSDPDILQ